jgi:hypothetical protein
MKSSGATTRPSTTSFLWLGSGSQRATAGDELTPDPYAGCVTGGLAALALRGRFFGTVFDLDVTELGTHHTDTEHLQRSTDGQSGGPR